MHGKCYKTLVCNIHLFAPDGLQRRIAFVRTSMSHFLEHTYFMGIQGILRVFIFRKSWWDQNLRICISQAIWCIELQTWYSDILSSTFESYLFYRVKFESCALLSCLLRRQLSKEAGEQTQTIAAENWKNSTRRAKVLGDFYIIALVFSKYRNPWHKRGFL